MDRFKKLQSGEIEWSSSIREYIREREMPNQCIYCGSIENLSCDHLIPRSRGGPDTADNVVMACKRFNSSKGDKGVYEWFKLDRRYEIPRIVEGKYLKLLYRLHSERGTLDVGKTDIEKLCNRCELNYLCDKPELAVYCLESILQRCRP